MLTRWISCGNGVRRAAPLHPRMQSGMGISLPAPFVVSDQPVETPPPTNCHCIHSQRVRDSYMQTLLPACFPPPQRGLQSVDCVATGGTAGCIQSPLPHLDGPVGISPHHLLDPLANQYRVPILGVLVRSLHVPLWQPLSLRPDMHPPSLREFFVPCSSSPCQIHTESIKKVGILEYVLNTPSHHRVHHARNPRYLDKNVTLPSPFPAPFV